MSSVPTEPRVTLIGCGILRKETAFLIAKNRWPVDTIYLDSALHCDFGQLRDRLEKALARSRNREIVVFYGTCHPLMDTMLSEAQVFRTQGQNCAEMLLGEEVFARELAAGAFFLMEEWAHRWKQMTFMTFGTDNEKVIREIYQGDRQYMLCLRTPCSGDFSEMAEAAGALVGLPVRWMDVSLDHLEQVLQTAISQKLRTIS